MSKEVGYLDSPSGKLFYVLNQPHGFPLGKSPEVVLIVPPFAEELNRSRKMLSDLSGYLCQSGLSSILLDLYGTGDSEGDFKDADWGIWCENIQLTKNWLLEKGFDSIILLGLRAGCLLISSLPTDQYTAISRICFLQPEIKGARLVKYLLRSKLSAGWVGKSGTASIAALREQIANGQSIEVGGYEINARLANALEEAGVERMSQSSGIPLSIIELVTELDAPPARSFRELAEGIQAQGQQVVLDRLSCEPFWAMNESTIDQALYPSLLDSLHLSKLAV